LNYYIIAGERSGDLHASLLMRALKERDLTANFRFFGGDYMSKEGGILVKHYKQMSFMGILEVILNLDKVFVNLNDCKSDILAHKPDVLILVDYSGFNLRIAKFAKKHGIKVFYYISPKIWAWNSLRANNIKKIVDRMFCILPFEKEFYKNYAYEVDYVGNPTVEEIRDFVPNPNFRKDNNLNQKPIIAVLPGSRKDEVTYMLHFMISILPAFREYQFVIAGVSNLDRKYYEAFKRNDYVFVVYEQTYDLLANARAAVVTSGTATLETALFNVPQVVCYATSGLTYLAAKILLKIKYISLVNLIANNHVVVELIQDEFIPSNLLKELYKITENQDERARILTGYKEVKEILGEESASQNTAELILKYL
jgi:lipid-A-disaccharide synthase